MCYSNTILQSLYFCLPFRTHVLEAKFSPEDSLLVQLQALFLQIVNSKRRTGVLNTKKLMSIVCSANQTFEGIAHQDSHEFLVWLLNEMNDQMMKKTKARTWVADLFEGKFSSETKCLGCETVTRREEPFWDLSVELEQNYSLSSCLRTFSKVETLTGNDKFLCDFCGCKQEAQKRVLIKQLPNVLVCHLKRFKFQEQRQTHQKLSHRVAFPSKLRIVNTTDDCPDVKFELISIVIHMGAGIQYGHYIAVVKCGEHWIKFDDENVERVDERLIQNIFGSAREAASVPCAYILLYKAVNS